MEEYKDQLDSEEVSKMREKITEVRDKLANKDEMDPEEIKSTVSDLQQSSLKLFEVAYKKVRPRDSNTSTSLAFHKPLREIHSRLRTVTICLLLHNFAPKNSKDHSTRVSLERLATGFVID